MTTQELKEYINSKLGNSLRTLLPSYWWKRLFGLVVDRVEEVDNKVEELKNNGSNTVTFYLTSDLNSEWAKKNYKGFNKLVTMGPGTAVSGLICTSHDEKFSVLFTDICVTGGLEVSSTGLVIPKVQFGGHTCDIHIVASGNAALCEIERLTFVDESLGYKDGWATLKTRELSQEVADLSVSIPLYYMTECENAELRTSITISDSGPAYIFGFVGNSEIVDGKIKSVDISDITISAPAVPNYTLKQGWYNDQGVYEKPRLYLRTRICSSEISVNPGTEYVIVSETNDFGIEIFEYDEQKNFIQKTLKHVYSEAPGGILAHSEITFAENTNYITFNLYYYGNDLTQTDIAFLDANQPFDELKMHYGIFRSSIAGTLRGLPAARDTRVGSALIRRVGERRFKEGDVNSDSLLTDGTTTIYALSPDEYQIETVMPGGIGFAGTAGGCTISSEIPVGICMWSNGTNLYMTQMGSSSKSYDNIIYSQMLAKQDPLISGTNIKTINGESILGSGNIEVSSGGSSYDDTELNNKVNGLQTQIDTLVSGDASTAIESFNEITAFLNGVEDTENLNSIISGIEQQIAVKQDTLVSGTNIKTINGESILGNGNITVSGNSSGSVTKADLVYAVSKSASQGRLTDPGYYYFNSPTTIDFGSVNQYPRGIYSIVIDGFSTWPLTALYPLNFIWTNGEPDFASFAGTTKVLEISLFVLDDDNSYKKVLATWALFNF